MNTANELQELLLQAMEIIANQSIKDSQKNSDITLWTCTITDDSKRQSGEYKVTDGSVTFQAYSQFTDYKKDDHVAVVIPKGDFNNTKYIVQKVAADGTLLPYASPLDNYVQITDNLIENFKTKSFDASVKEQEIAAIKLTNSYSAETSQGRALYNALIFKGDFQTSFSRFKNVKGNYGIKIVLKYVNELNYPQEQTLTFDSSQFLGNIYNFMVPSTQKKAFSLNKGESLKEISIRFYQNLVLPIGTNKNNLPLIELKNLQLYFGSDISGIEDNTLELYSLEKLQFFGDVGEQDAENNKHIGLMWHNKNDNGSFIGFSDGIYDVEYDEIKYLTEKAKSEAIANEAKKENASKYINGLRAAAALTKIEECSQEVLSNMDKIISTAASLDLECYGIFSKITTTNGTNVNKFLEKISNKEAYSEDGYLAHFHREFEKASESFISAYRKELITSNEVAATFPADTLEGLDKILTLDSTFTYFLGTEVEAELKNTYGGYHSIFTSYDDKVKKYRALIKGALDKIQDYLNTLTEYWEKRNEGDKYGETDDEDESIKIFDEESYKNRYCVYWYEYEQGYVSSNEYDQKFVGNNWKRLSNLDSFWNPGAGKTVQDVVYNAPLKKDNFTYTISPAAKKKELMAVLFYNHNEYKSKPLAFQKMSSDGTIIDDNGVFEIIHGKNSQDAYQFYGEDFSLINSSEGRRERILSLNFLSTLGRSLKDFVGGEIYWYLPQNLTMLRYDPESDIISTYSLSKDVESTNPKHYKPGYYCFTKSIKLKTEIQKNEQGEDVEVEIPLVEDLSFSYLINDYYSKSYNNNTVYCKIVKGSWSYEAYISLNFSSYGTSGTDYTLSFQIPPGGRSAITAEEGMVLYLKLFDYNNEEIALYAGAAPDDNSSTIYGHSVTTEWIGTAEANPTKALAQEGSFVKITLNASRTGEPSYGILKVTATVKDKKDKKNEEINGIKLVNFYSVPYSIPSTPGSKDFISGPTRITYSSFGNNPKEYKDPYRIYRGSDKQEITGVTWSILKGTADENGYPKIDQTNKLIPKNSYVQNVVQKIPVAYVKKEAIEWYQPILIQQDQYEFQLLNKWDGSMEINKEEGYILSNMLVAGEKDENNVFSGVVIGETAKLNGDATDYIEHQSGMFGFDKGVRSFAFKTDGTAYLGKSGSGRIEFNGDKGTITSAGYNEGKGTGILIDLDDPKFHIVKTVNDVTKDLFFLNYKDPNNIFFLRSFDFAEDEKKGFELDIQNGKLKAYSGLSIVTSDFNLISTKNDFAIKISSDDFILKADTNYYISKSENSVYGVTAGIKWGEYFHATTDSFHIGKEDGTNIQGKNGAITFNFDNGKFLKFSSDCFEVKGTNDGITKTTINIQSGTQVLESTNFTEPNDTYPLGKGTSINLINGEVKAYSGFKLKTSEFELMSTIGDFALIMKPDSFLLQADKNHFISKDPEKGIQWGSYLLANSSSFRIGDEKGTYIGSTANASGEFDGLTFRFKSGEFLTFSTDGLMTEDNTVTISKDSEILKSAEFNDDIELGSLKGTRFNLKEGTLEAYSGLLIKADDNNYIQLNQGEIEIKAQNFNLNTQSSSAFISSIEYKNNSLIIKNGAGTNLNISDVNYQESSDICNFKLDGKNGQITGMGNKNGNYKLVYNSQVIATGTASEQEFTQYIANCNYHVSEEYNWEDIPLSFIFIPNDNGGNVTLKLNGQAINDLNITVADITDSSNTSGTSYEIECKIDNTTWLVIRVDIAVPQRINIEPITLTEEIKVNNYICSPSHSVSKIKTSYETIKKWKAQISSPDTQIILSSSAPLCPLQLGDSIKMYWNGSADFSSLIISNFFNISANKSSIAFQLNDSETTYQSSFDFKKLGESEITSLTPLQYIQGTAFSMEQCVIEKLLIAEDIYVGKVGGGLYVGSIYPRSQGSSLRLRDGNGKARLIIDKLGTRFINNKNANVMSIKVDDNDSNVYFNVKQEDSSIEVSAQSLYDDILEFKNTSVTLENDIANLKIDCYKKTTLPGQTYQQLKSNGGVSLNNRYSNIQFTGISIGEDNKIFIGHQDAKNNNGMNGYDIYLKVGGIYYGIIEWLNKDFTRTSPWEKDLEES